MAGPRDFRQAWLLAAGGVALALMIALRAWVGVSWTLAYLGGISLASFAAYGYDKSSAQRGGGRIPEAVLHILAAVGGSPGALAGQLTFRHKTAKQSFQLVFWAIVVLQGAALRLAWRGGYVGL